MGKQFSPTEKGNRWEMIMCFYDFRKQLGIKRRCFEAKTLLDTTFSIILEYSLIPAFISHSKDTKNIFVFEFPVFFCASVHKFGKMWHASLECQMIE